MSFQEIHTDMVEKIKPKEMLNEIYFFTFTNAYSKYMHIYTAKTKDKWLGHLETYYAYAQNKSNKAKVIVITCLNSTPELGSIKSNK